MDARLLDDQPLGVIGRSVYAVVVAYLILNRLIADLYVLPIGLSLRPYEALLAILLGLWALWMVVEPKPLPMGTLGLTAFALFVIFGAAPFFWALTFTVFESNGAERGIFRLFMFSGLFLASFQLAFRLQSGKKLLGWVVALTTGQTLVALYEFITKEPVGFFQNLALGMGLEFDPRSLRPEVTEVFQRITGEIRAATTAPHPIVLSAVISVAVLVCFAWLIHAQTAREKRWARVALAINAIGLPLANSRTGFVIAVACGGVMIFMMIKYAPRLLPMSLAGAMLLGAAFAVSPETPRLLLNSVFQADEDENTQIRLERFARLPELVSPRPAVGAGYLTHDPGVQIFDNAYNLQLIEGGVVGLTATVVFFLTAINWCRRGYHHGRREEQILPLVGVIAGVALLAGGSTFDAWTFDQFLPTCLILLGLGAGRSTLILRRVTQPKPIFRLVTS